MNALEQQKVLAICIRAAYADGSQTEDERAQVRKIADEFHHHAALTSAYQEAFDQGVPLFQLTQGLQSPEARALAYEMAVCVCSVDGATTTDERNFLQSLHTELKLDPELTDAIRTQAEQLAPPVLFNAPATPAGTANQDTEALILNYAILTGALELLPQSIATMAIIPIQIRMVHRIGQQHGFELSRRHIQDFLATVGVGLTSQAVEGYARKLFGSLARSVGGKLASGAAQMATGPAFAFGTTYTLGQLASHYYAAGRKLDAAQLQQVFSSFLQEGSTLYQRYAGPIAEKSRQLTSGNLVSLVKES